MTTYRTPAPEGLEFGYVCSAPFLADVRVGGGTLPVFKEPASKAAVGFEFYRESLRKPNRLVVTRGDLVDRAIVISDTCAVKTALGRGGATARGRVWFAPLRKLETAAQVQAVEDTPNAFDRLLLPPDDATQGYWVVELQRAFPADAAAVRQALEANRSNFVLFALDDEIAGDLRARWAANTVRCGPLVALDNADHVIDRLEESGIPTTEATTAATALTAVAAASWTFEGSSLEAAGALRGEEAMPLAPAVDGMLQDLTSLRDQVAMALQTLASIRDRL